MPVTLSAPPVEINAPLLFVWEVLTDFEHYPAWNPFTVHVRTSRVIGEPVYLDVHMGASFKSLEKEKLIAYQPPHQLAWGGKFPPFLMVATRWQELAALENNRTCYQTHETFSGLLEPLTMFFYRADIEQGFIDTGLALKRRVESLFQP